MSYYKNRIIILTLFLFTFCISIPNVFAAECVDYKNGTGTVEDPYQITTNEELFSINCNLDSNFVLMNDIDLTEETTNVEGKFYNNGKGWHPIGDTNLTDFSSGDKFTGYFDGNNNKISGLTQNLNANTCNFYENYNGLFYEISGTVENLILDKVNINYNIGVNCSSYYGEPEASSLADVITGTVRNVTLNGKISVTSSINNAQLVKVGGLASKLENGYIQNVTNNIEISSSALSSLAGIVSEVNGGTITMSQNNAKITGANSYIGGIASNLYSNKDSIGVIERSYNYGTLDGRKVAGISQNLQGAKIESCVNYGTINLTSNGGGIAGFAFTSSIWESENQYTDYGAIINKCINLGTINLTPGEKDGDVGGIVGSAGSRELTKIINSYNIGEINITRPSSYTVVGGLVGRHSGQLISSYNIGNINIIDPPSSYADHISELVGAIVRCDTVETAGLVDNSYYIERGTKALSNDGASNALNYKSLTKDNMYIRESYEGFDFDNIWEFNIENGYKFPQLKGMSLQEEYVSEINIISDRNTIEQNSTLQLNITSNLGSLTNDNIEWSIISGEELGLISSSGVLTPLSKGKIIIRATYKKMNIIYDDIEIIVTKNINLASIKNIENVIYNGTNQEPEVIITDGLTQLIKDVDFNVSYSNNKNAGKGKIIITGINNYSGSKEINFNIEKADIDYEINNQTTTYNKNEQSLTMNLITNNAIVKYANSNDEYILDEIPKYKTPGEYIIKYYIYVDDNYNSVYGNSKLIINKANITDYNVSSEDKIYDGKDSSLSVTANIDSAVIKYSENGLQYSLLNPPKYNSVGLYKIYFEITAPYYNTFYGYRELNIFGIKKIDPSITLKNNMLIFSNNSFRNLSNNIHLHSLNHTYTHLNQNKEKLDNDKIKTGDYINIKVNGIKDYEYRLIRLGDVNGNGEIDIIDYIRIMKHIMGTSILSDTYYESADMNRNNNIDIIDYIRVMKIIMEEK